MSWSKKILEMTGEMLEAERTRHRPSESFSEESVTDFVKRYKEALSKRSFGAG